MAFRKLTMRHRSTGLRSVIAPRPGAIAAENWFDVPELVSSLHVEADAGTSIEIDKQPAVPQNARAPIERRSIQFDDLDARGRKYSISRSAISSSTARL
jgi:hypothetical protein